MERVGELLAALSQEDDREFLLLVEKQLTAHFCESVAAGTAGPPPPPLAFPAFTGHHRFLVHLAAERLQLRSASASFGYDKVTTVSVDTRLRRPLRRPLLALEDLVPARCPLLCAAALDLSALVASCGAARAKPNVAEIPSKALPSVVSPVQATPLQADASRLENPLQLCETSSSTPGTADRAPRKRGMQTAVYQPPQRRLETSGATSPTVEAGETVPRAPQGWGAGQLDPVGGPASDVPEASTWAGDQTEAEERLPVPTALDFSAWEADTQRVLAEEWEQKYGRMKRYVDCSGRGEYVWSRVWLLPTPGNGAVLFAVPSAVIDQRQRVALALACQPPGHGVRRDKSCKRGATQASSGGMYEVVLDWGNDCVTVRRSDVVVVWEKTATLSELTLQDSDTARIVDPEAGRDRALLSVQPGCTQKWWVAVRDGLIFVGSGSAIGSAIVLAARDTATPLRVQAVGFACLDGEATLKAISLTRALGRSMAHLGHILLVEDWARCCKEEPSDNTGAAQVEAWAASLISSAFPAPSLQVRIADSRFLWLLCGSVAQALELVNKCAGNDGKADCARVHRAPQWLHAGVPEETLANAGFGSPANARPVTSAHVAKRLIDRHINRPARTENARPR